MCLAIPVLIRALGPDDTALAEIGGITREINTALVDGLAVGDYVVLHVGFALTRIDPAEAERTLALMAEQGLVEPALAELSP